MCGVLCGATPTARVHSCSLRGQVVPASLCEYDSRLAPVGELQYAANALCLVGYGSAYVQRIYSVCLGFWIL